MSARTYALVRSDAKAQLVTVEADITEGLPTTVLRGLPDDRLHTARDRIRAAIVNSGYGWPTAQITVSVGSAKPVRSASCIDLAVAMAILAAAKDVPSVGLGNKLFLAELGLDGRLRSVDDISALLASMTRNELPAAPEDNILNDDFVLVVPRDDVPAAIEAIAASSVPFVRVVGAYRIDDVAAWVCGKARLRATLLEDQAE